MNKSLLKVARGDEKADLVLKNGKIVDLYNCEIIEADLAISAGIIIGHGEYKGREEKDLEGKYILPGFIDAHLHLESSMVEPAEFCRLAINRGTLTVIADPHEIANVTGIDGIKYFLDQGNKLPWNFHLMLPSCVPATEAETTGANLTADELYSLITEQGVFGLGEMMDYSGVINGNQIVWDKLEAFRDYFIDGHAPEVTNKELNAYLLGGIQADHECTTAKEAKEKIAKGMHVMIREGSVTKDMEKLLPAVNDINNYLFMLATDDRHADDLLLEGQIDYLIKRAIELGMEPIKAYRLATLNPAKALGLNDRGAISPGKRADLVIIDDLEKVKISEVYKDGELISKDYKETGFPNINKDAEIYQNVIDTVNISDVEKEDFSLPLAKTYRVIELIENQIITREREMERKPGENPEEFLIRNKLTRVAVIERHNATGNIGLGLLNGLDIKKGAIASSVAHDSHNIIVAGRNREDMIKAVRRLEDLSGGQVVVSEGEVIAELPLPIAGLMSDLSMEEVSKRLKALDKAAADIGINLESPFMVLAFLALPVIPDIKITDQGLYDVKSSKHIDLTVN